MLSPSQLLTLRSVLSTGSFAAAASALHYTPSAVSQQIAALERATGLSLFERDAHSVRATAAAHQLAERSAGLLDVLADLDRDVAELARGDTGRLRIGSFPTAGARLLPAALAELLADRPDVDLDVDEAEPDVLLPRLLAGELDLALMYRYDTVAADWPRSLVTVELRAERLSVLLPSDHPSATATTIRLSALRRSRWVAPLGGSPGAVNLDRLTAAAGFEPRIAFRSNDYAVVHGLVAAGLGVALVPALALNPVPTPGVSAVPLAGRTARRRVLAAYRATARNPLIPAMLAALTRWSAA